MNTYINCFRYFVLFSLSLLLNCANETRPADPMDAGQDTLTQNSLAYPRVDLKRDATRLERNPRNIDWYVYYYNAPTVPVEAPDTLNDDGHGSLMTEGEVPYTVSLTDRPPIFGVDCLVSDEPEACSNEAIRKFLNKHINYNNLALEADNEGLERITFTIDEEGKVSGDIRAEARKKPCKPCAEAAIKAIAKMEDKWAPALKAGEAVSVSVTLPVRFQTEE